RLPAAGLHLPRHLARPAGGTLQRGGPRHRLDAGHGQFGQRADRRREPGAASAGPATGQAGQTGPACQARPATAGPARSTAPTTTAVAATLASILSLYDETRTTGGLRCRPQGPRSTAGGRGGGRPARAKGG